MHAHTSSRIRQQIGLAGSAQLKVVEGLHGSTATAAAGTASNASASGMMALDIFKGAGIVTIVGCSHTHSLSSC